MNNLAASSVFSGFAVMILPLVLEIATVFLLGLIAVPLLRSKKTGRFEWRVGKRFKTDGTEPYLGGAVAALAFAVWFFPISVLADISGSNNRQDSREGLIFAGIYVIIIMCVGAAEDVLRHFRARPAGVSGFMKQLTIYCVSLFLLFMLTITGGRSTEVLLPFNLGFVEFGVLYYPLMALFMTLMVNVFRLHFSFGSSDREFVGGLTEITGGLSLMTIALCCEVCCLYCGSDFADIAAAACVGMLIWTLSPSKLISGESGAAFAGAAFSAAVILSKLELLFLLAALPQIADVLAAAVNYIRFKKKKKSGAVSGSSKCPAHVILRQRGASDYIIILVFSVLSLIGGALSLIFAYYARGFIWLI